MTDAKKEQFDYEVAPAPTTVKLHDRDLDSVLPQSVFFDNTTMLNPARLFQRGDPEANREILTDTQLSADLDRLELRIRAAIELLEESSSDVEAVQAAEQGYSKYSELRKKNLATIYETIRPYEEKVRSLDALYKNASTSPNERVAVWLFNADPESVFNKSSALSEEFWTQIENKNAKAFYKDRSYSYLVVPGNFARPEIIREWDSQLKDNRLLLVSDLFHGKAIVKRFDDLKGQLDANAFSDLRDDTLARAHVVGCFNDILVRSAYDEYESKGIFLPASIFVAGKMYRIDNDFGLADVPAGADKGMGTIAGGIDTKVELNDEETDVLHNKYNVVPIVTPKGKGGPLQIYGVRSLCAAKPYDQYSVVKVYNYIGRVLNDIAEQKRFRKSDRGTLHQFENLVRTFLDKAKGHLFEDYGNLRDSQGQVVQLVRYDPEDSARLLCSCGIKYFRNVEQFEFEVGYRMRDEADA